MAECDVITAGTSTVEGCPALGRARAFVMHQGVAATLEHTFHNRQGNPMALSCDSDSESEADEPTVLVRISEIEAESCQIIRVEGQIVDAAAGTVRVALPCAVTDRQGLYRVSWAYVQGGQIRLINNTLLSVERSLFGTQPTDPAAGPPTLDEIRMQMMDSAQDNLLLQDVEFGDEQILMAIMKPIHEFNEMQPPINRRATSRNFPYRHHWIEATIGYLMRFAADGYRRNRLAVNSGGMPIDDKNKEREYLQASQLRLQEWREFAKMKKMELNAQAAFGRFE